MIDKHTENSINNYNKLAKDYDNSLDGLFTRDLKVQLLKYLSLEPDAYVLDVACANGTLLELINNKKPIQGYGIDISNEMIKIAQSLHPSFTFKVSNSSNIPFEDSFFDVITVCAAFHHFSEPLVFLKEAKRVLKKDGLLFIMEPYFNSFIRILFNLLIPVMTMGDVKVYKKEEIEEMITKSGLANVHYSRETDHGCLFIAKLT